ncbi:hypothetical protein [Ruminococcus albus]|uniref:Uncharacterized protein n=1 Tax=Ruminococcus albus TaxID=1264 RepID=A0A1H7PJ72_RUMAL|nr:hypothetical protein [Ruminococcus albus]SEL35831.1 hypothetical protein SAMN05216469_12218 [Ruminococcus albus]
MMNIDAYFEALRLCLVDVFGKDTFTEDEMTKEFYVDLKIRCGSFFETEYNAAVNMDMFWSEQLKDYLMTPKVPNQQAIDWKEIQKCLELVFGKSQFTQQELENHEFWDEFRDHSADLFLTEDKVFLRNFFYSDALKKWLMSTK